MFQDGEGACTGVDLLGCTEELIDLRQQFLEGATSAKHLYEYLGMALHQCAGDFFPAAFGCQGLQLSRLTQLPHQRKGFIGNGKAQAGIAGGKARNAQHA
ncbi:hypothetical protein D9M73_140770 [compost metagenome]